MIIEQGDYPGTVYVQLLDTDLADLKTSEESIKQLEAIPITLHTLHLKFKPNAKLLGLPLLGSFIAKNQNFSAIILDFAAQDLCTSDLEILCNALGKTPVAEIYLPHSLNLLTEDHFTILSNTLSKCKKLTKLNISRTLLEGYSDPTFNKIGDLIVQCQPKFLEITTDFRTLHPDRFQAFCQVLTHGKIQYLTGAYEQSEEQSTILCNLLDANKEIVRQELNDSAHKAVQQTLQEITKIMAQLEPFMNLTGLDAGMSNGSNQPTEERKITQEASEVLHAKDQNAITSEQTTPAPPQTMQYNTLVRKKQPAITNITQLAFITRPWYMKKHPVK